MTYKEEIIKAMELLSKDDRTIFLGQQVCYSGSAIFHTCSCIPKNKILELPIIEDCQMGISTGLSLQGYIPISIYPRFDFLLLATNQLVNHLDKINRMSTGRFKPKVIIRTAVGATEPLYPGLQHCSDYTEGFKKMLKEVKVVVLDNAKDIVPEYKKALESTTSTLLIEKVDLYGTR